MTVSDAVLSCAKAVKFVTGLVTVRTPVRGVHIRPYVTVGLVTSRALSQGGVVFEEGNLLNKWLAQIIVDVNLYADDEELVSLTEGKLKALVGFSSNILITDLGDFQELTAGWQAQIERRFFLQITLKAELSQILSENENPIEKVNLPHMEIKNNRLVGEDAHE